MTAATHPITIKQGADWRYTVELSTQFDEPLPYIVTAARMEIRDAFAAAEPLASLTSEPGGGIEIVSTTSVIRLVLTLPRAVTADLPNVPMVYDLFLIDDADLASCPMQGPLRIIQRATHLP